MTAAVKCNKGSPTFTTFIVVVVVDRSALTKLLCGLYALLLVVFGGVFAVANALTVQERQHLYYLEVRTHLSSVPQVPGYKHHIPRSLSFLYNTHSPCLYLLAKVYNLSTINILG